MMLRKYQPEDCEDVLNVWARASAPAHPFLSEEFQAVERRNIRDVHLPQAETWVWEADGRVVGFLSLVENEVGGIFVDPEYQRNGIGRVLIEKARLLRGDLEVEVFARNELGRGFYASLGFGLVERKNDHPSGFEILRLRLAAERQQADMESPFESIESAQEFVRLLAEAVKDAQTEVGVLIGETVQAGQPRREEALRLVAHKLDSLLLHMNKSQRVLKDLRTLRRLLEGDG